MLYILNSLQWIRVHRPPLAHAVRCADTGARIWGIVCIINGRRQHSPKPQTCVPLALGADARAPALGFFDPATCVRRAWCICVKSARARKSISIISPGTGRLPHAEVCSYACRCCAVVTTSATCAVPFTIPISGSIARQASSLRRHLSFVNVSCALLSPSPSSCRLMGSRSVCIHLGLGTVPTKTRHS